MDTGCFQCIYPVAQSRPCVPMLLQPYNIWTDCFQCIYPVAQSRPCVPMLLQPYNIWTLIVSNVFIWLRSHGHASRCYCSHIIIWTLVVSNVFILLMLVKASGRRLFKIVNRCLAAGCSNVSPASVSLILVGERYRI